MLLSLEKCRGFIVCPRTGSHLVESEDGSSYVSRSGGTEYAVIDGFPILVDFESSLLSKDSIISNQAESQVLRTKHRGLAKIAKALVSRRRQTTQNNFSFIQDSLRSRSKPLVLIVGGGTVGASMESLYLDLNIEIVSFDIYGTDSVQFIADGHAIPLASETFDCVIVQAVLEHVLSPSKVVGEIHRVLKGDGIVYAETPFMQQVHESAFDFTRFSDSGHRYLFRNFTIIRSGSTGGAGTALIGSIDYFFRSLFRSRLVGKVAKTMFFWLSYFDLVIPEKYSVDAASGVYFLGTKSDYTLKPIEIVDYYSGAD